MCLQYIVMALAATTTEKFRHLATPFYQRSRAYAESDEMMVSFANHTKFRSNTFAGSRGAIYNCGTCTMLDPDFLFRN
jgi:hypothetical protein